jgi:fibronectin type III domain protein
MDLLIKDLEAGQKYIFQVRAKDGTGKTSAWSTAFEVTTTSDTVPPKPVTDFTWDVVGTSFVATWTKPVEDANDKPLKDLRDYKVTLTADGTDVVYFVTQEKFDLPLEVNRNSFGTPKPTVEITVQARDRTGNLSTEVSDTASNPIPNNITNFVADGISSAISLTWDANTDDDLKFYEVYMSTSGSGFTPGPTNLVYTGLATSFVYSTSSAIEHFFKARAVDVFNQGSAAYAVDSAIPESSSGIDLTPPDAPTAVVATTDDEADGYAKINVSWTASGSSSVSDYVVRYSVDEVAWIYVNVPGDQTEATISGLLPDTDYYVSVAAMSYANVKSSFVDAGTYPITTAADTSAPSQPAAPTVSTSTLMAQVSHDMTKQGGGDLESDVAYLEVHASTSSGFAPSNTTLRGTIDVAGAGVDVSGVFYYAANSTSTLYWKVIAVDRSKNKSTASNQTTGTPGLIENANIANATITSAKIQDLEANKITAGTGIINNLDIKSTLTIGTAGHIRSSDYNAGTETGFSLDTTGLTIYDGTIHAEALLLQDSPNVIPPAFADFEFNEEYYHATGVPNALVSSSTSGLLLEKNDDSRFGNTSMRVYNTSITNPTKHNYIFAPGGLATTGVNIEVSPGQYVFSLYAKKNGAPNGLMSLNLYSDAGASITSSDQSVTNTSWTRYETLLTVPSGVDKVKAYISIGPAAANTGYDILIDGVQLERVLTAETSAGIWRPPSTTTIDGGSIVTGSIRSSAASATVPNQPAWSINTAGNMQVGDASVRGTLIVGSINDKINLVPEALSSFERQEEYYHTPDYVPHYANIYPEPDVKLRVYDNGNAYHSNQFLRVYTDAPDIGVNGDRYVFFSGSGGYTIGNNITVIPGRDYIYSAYVRPFNTVTNQSVQLCVFSTGPGLDAVGSETVLSTSVSPVVWTRIYGTWTAPPGVETCQLAIFARAKDGANKIDFAVDAIMFEVASPDPDGIVIGNFEDNLDGWFAGGNTPLAEIERDIERATTGSSSLHIAWPDTDSHFINLIYPDCIIGESYTVTADVWVPSPSTAIALGRISGTVINGTPNSTNNAWEEITFSFTATSEEEVIIIVPNGGMANAGDEAWIDNIRISGGESISIPSTYVYPGTGSAYVKSNNYVPGDSGWAINDHGSVEFNDGIFRGSLDITGEFEDHQFSTLVKNMASSWASPGVSGFTLQGIEPAVVFKGTSFVPNAAGTGYTPSKDVQSVFRLTPEGGVQIMVDPSHGSNIFTNDGNNDVYLYPNTLQAYEYIQEYYGYSDYRAGRGLSRDFGAILQDNEGGAWDNIYYTQNHVKSITPSSMGRSDNAAGQLAWTDASTSTLDYRPYSASRLYAESTVTIDNANIIPIYWDNIAPTGSGYTLTTYQNNAFESNITLTGVTTPVTSAYLPLRNQNGAAIERFGVTGVVANSAVAANASIWFGATDTTYNVSVDPLEKYCMRIYMGFGANFTGKSVVFRMKFSNGNVVESSAKSIATYGHLNGTATDPFYMVESDAFTIPSGITSAIVGFRFAGTNFGTGAGNTFYFHDAALVRITNNDGEIKRSPYARNMMVPNLTDGLDQTWTGRALIEATASGVDPTLRSDLDYAAGAALNNPFATTYADANAKIRLYTYQADVDTGETRGFEFSISPHGARWGKDTEYRWQNADVWEWSGSIGWASSTTGLNVPTASMTAPAPPTLTKSDGRSMIASFVDGDPVGSYELYNSGGGQTNGYRYICKKAGLYEVSAMLEITHPITGAGGNPASLTEATPNQYMELYNVTTGVVYAVFAKFFRSYRLAGSIVIPASAGDRLAVRFTNAVGSSQTLTQYRISFTQIL